MCGAALVPAVVAAGSGQGRTSTGDLVLPLVAAVAALAVAAYTSVRRKVRATTRTTPGGSAPTVVALDELDRRTARLLVLTDDCVRTSREELGYAAAPFGDEAVRSGAEAVEFAAAELAEAFLTRQRFDDGEGERRLLLEDLVARCDAAGRRLDAEAAGFDRTRALERTAQEAMEQAEARFRRLAARVAEADGTLAGLRERYALSAYLPVTGHDEQAKDRLVFATTCLNRVRQALDLGEREKAVVQLRAVEAAVDQAALLLDGVTRLASGLATARAELPAALSAVEGDLAQARRHLGTETARADLRGRIAYGESVVAAVREDMESGTAGEEDAPDEAAVTGRGHRARCDPVGALRRIEQVAVGLDRAMRRLPDGTRALGRLRWALLVAGGTVRAASDYVTTHRGAVGCEARTRLAEAERRLRGAENTDAPPVPAPVEALADAREADALARQAGQLAERDVRAFGTPYGEGVWTGGAVLGGILLDAPHRRGESPGYPGDGGPASYGGPATRGRRDGGELFRPLPPRGEPFRPLPPRKPPSENPENPGKPA